MLPPVPDTTTAACRIYVLLAGDGRSAVIFRRGPSRLVLVLRWWLGSDTIEPGQWLRGRIYERRSDLSHDGELLIYFAAKWQTSMATWTAVSRPPYLSALAIWPKGDAWGGGGLFQGGRTIGLNHAGDAAARASSARLPKTYRIVPCADWAGKGEDNPIAHTRMIRDGWRCLATGKAERYGSSQEFAWKLSEPEIYERVSPNAPPGFEGLALHRALRGVGQRDGAWYVEDFSVRTADGTLLRVIEGASWADWQANGDLLLALDGRIYRVVRRDVGEVAVDPLHGARLVVDLRGSKFTPTAAPAAALRWP